MKVKDLPKAIKRRAMPYIKENFPNKKHRPKGIMEAFDWTLTEEGFDYWKLVNDGEFLKAEKLLSERLKEEYPLAYKITQLIEDDCWIGTSNDSCRDTPFFLDEVLVNEPEVVKPDNNLPWHLTTEDAPIFNSGDTKTDAINLGIQSVRIINDSFKKAIEMKRDRIVEGVIEKFRSRSEVGIKKYGTTLADNNTDDFLNHLQEELMDAILYIEKLKDR